MEHFANVDVRYEKQNSTIYLNYLGCLSFRTYNQHFFTHIGEDSINVLKYHRFVTIYLISVISILPYTFQQREGNYNQL